MDTEVHIAWASSPSFSHRDDARRALDAVGAAAAASALGVAPGSLSLTRRCPSCGSRAHGRPAVVGSDVLVSLTRAIHGDVAALVGAAIAPSPGILGLGIDVENISANADRVLGLVAGAEALSSDPLRAWVRAEATLKATGQALAGEVVSVPPAGHPGPWTVVDVDLAPDLVCTVAVEGASTVRLVRT